jgi:hypothetical protein
VGVVDEGATGSVFFLVQVKGDARDQVRRLRRSGRTSSGSG